MADSEGTPPAPAPIDAPDQAKPVAPAPRVNPPNINAGKEAPADPSIPPGFGEFLEWMRSKAGEQPAPGSATSRSLIPKEKKKFQRHADDPRSPLETSTPETKLEVPKAETAAPASSLSPPPVGAEAPRAIAPPLSSAAAAATAEPAGPRVRRGQQAASNRNSWLGLAVQIGALILIAGAFFLGRASVTKVTQTAAAPAAPVMVDKEGKATTNLLSDANATLIDQAMAAEQAADFKKTRELLEKVRDSGEHVHGLTFQLAQLAVFAGEFNRAVPLLNQALAEGEDLGQVYNLRATISSRASMMNNSSMNDYETATKIEPFGAQSYFYWGAALRRAGKPQAALKRLQQALDRLKEPTAESYYRLAIRLTLIQLNQEADFAGELGRQLALPTPDMDWLFTAAAIAIRDGRGAEAAGFIERASRCGDSDGYSMRMRDYSFYQHRFDKELTRFYTTLEPVRASNQTSDPVPAGSPAPSPTGESFSGLPVPDLPPPASLGTTVPR